MKHRILVLGGTGMLGSMVTDYLSRMSDVRVTATTRTEEAAKDWENILPGVDWRTFDALTIDSDTYPKVFDDCDWVINCIGIIKPLIHDENADEVQCAVIVNSLFPHLLARWTAGSAKVLQIATDCVYSGTKGLYTETDTQDPLDVYGKTKSLGEVYARNVYHLRCSIIGPEGKQPKSLMEWFLGQRDGATVNGFVNHSWNGITTLHFAKLCAGIIKHQPALKHVQHVVPGNVLTKCEMLEQFARCYGRNDIIIRPTEAATIVDRTLATDDEGFNRELWATAGYDELPTVPHMIEELAQFNFRAKTGDRLITA